MPYDLRGKRIWVAGHRGMVGGAVVRGLTSEPCEVTTAGTDVAALADPVVLQAGFSTDRTEVFALTSAKSCFRSLGDNALVDPITQSQMIFEGIPEAEHKHAFARADFFAFPCPHLKIEWRPFPSGISSTSKIGR